MQDKGSVHKQVQDMCDCYATTDPLKEMSTLAGDADVQAAAFKWVALAALHGVNQNAAKITINRNDDGKVAVTAEYRTADLPSPGDAVGGKVFDILRQITHIEADKGKTALALGIRDSSLGLKIKVKRKQASETITIKFPDK